MKLPTTTAASLRAAQHDVSPARAQQLLSILAAAAIALSSPLGALAQIDVVDRVVDGDTIIAHNLGRARLIGVNTPETVAPAQQQGAPAQCYGAEASKKLKELLPVGTRVRLETDVAPTDKYGRSLVYVYREPDDLFINGALVEGGFARAKMYKPNVQYAGLLESLQKNAQARHVGLWGACGDQAMPSNIRPTVARSSQLPATASLVATSVKVAAADSAPPAASAPIARAQSPKSVGTPPPNPGDTKNCSDFKTYAEAKAWYDTYFPFYGDVARLDGNNDGVPCESLPGRKL
mmetsp:Transcript_100529/g.138607  ORF Transcript_100529/g.138607 Transcript_100529/m.138607 type:complete len:292 (-) Transcript_100529:238-1113(-)